MGGKAIRLRRLFNPDGTIFLAMDHGFTNGPISGIETIQAMQELILSIRPDAIILHKGMLKSLSLHINNETKIIMHLSASLNFPNCANVKYLVATVEEAIRYGADGISVQINFYKKMPQSILQDLASVSERCEYWGIPLLAMLYPVIDPNEVKEEFNDLLLHGIRVCIECGVDMIKIPYFDDIDRYSNIIIHNNIPVLGAGGEITDFHKKLKPMISKMFNSGCSGVCIGRNIFQSEHPQKIIEMIREVIKENKTRLFQI